MEGVAWLYHAPTNAPNSIGDAVTPQAHRSCHPSKKLWLCSPGLMGAGGFDGWMGGAELSVTWGNNSLGAALTLQLSTLLWWQQCKRTSLPSLHAHGLVETAPKSPSCPEPAWLSGLRELVAHSPGLWAQL